MGLLKHSCANVSIIAYVLEDSLAPMPHVILGSCVFTRLLFLKT